MTQEAPSPDPSVLLEVTRGFVGLREPRTILRHALLSAMGACGARFALFLTRDRNGSLVLNASRGLSQESVAELPLSRSAEKALLEARGALAGEALGILGAAAGKWIARSGIQCAAPVIREDRVEGLFALGPKLLGERFTGAERALVAELAEMTAAALWPETERAGAGERRADSRRDLDQLRARHPALQAIQGEGESTRELCREILALSDFELPVLIIGETGTGKELVARALHELSPRAAHPFEAINCASIPHDLMAGALFGHERGAFTGAVSTVRGAFERAGEGTIFLDEIGDMPPETQASLLRVLQENRFRRVGGEKLLPARARVISATNRDLAEEAAAHRFRPDLFYRLQMYSIRLHPLRERHGEIPALITHILRRMEGGRRPRPAASPEFVRKIAELELPGNFRELESLVLGAVVRARGEATLRVEHLVLTERPGTIRSAASPLSPARSKSDPPSSAPAEPTTAPPAPSKRTASYQEMERKYILSVLEETRGNRQKAAELMGIPRTTLNGRIRRLGLNSAK